MVRTTAFHLLVLQWSFRRDLEHSFQGASVFIRSTGQNLRYWHQESPLQFFGIYPPKSYLQKQASLSVLPSASLQRLPTSQFPPWRSSNIDTRTQVGGYIQISSVQFRRESGNKQPHRWALWFGFTDTTEHSEIKPPSSLRADGHLQRGDVHLIENVQNL